MTDTLATPPEAAPADAANARQIQLQRIYLKDASLEMPLAPAVFKQAWNPQIDLQMGTTVTSLEENIFHVVLAVTVTAKLGEETAFLVEVHQAGIFSAAGFAPQELQAVLSSYCPNQLFPYAREAVAGLITRTGFPPVLLQPINFEALYMEHVARAQAQGGGAAPAPGTLVQ